MVSTAVAQGVGPLVSSACPVHFGIGVLLSAPRPGLALNSGRKVIPLGSAPNAWRGDRALNIPRAGVWAQQPRQARTEVLH